MGAASGVWRSTSRRADEAEDAGIAARRATRHAAYAGAVAGIARGMRLGDLTEMDIAARCVEVGRTSGWTSREVFAAVMRGAR